MNIVLPGLGDIDEVEVTEISAVIGDMLDADDPIIVIESDKASMEVPAGSAGTLVKLYVSLGDRLGEGAIIGQIKTDADGEAIESATALEPQSVSEQQYPIAEEPNENYSTGSSAHTVEIRVPDLGDIEQVEVIEVAAESGSKVSPGDLLVVLESDKASVEIPAEVNGVLIDVCVAVGDQVSEGSVLALAQVAEPLRELIVPEPELIQASRQTSPKTNQTANAEVAVSNDDQGPQAQSSLASMISSADSGHVYAGPATRRLAREIGVPLRYVVGSGNRGRITKDDVKAWAKARLNAPTNASAEGVLGIPSLPTLDFAKFGIIEEVPLSRIQKQVAANMHRSWLNIPHVTQHAHADIDDLETFRQGMKAEAETRGIKLTPLPFIIKAVCQTLNAHPKLNGSLSADAERLVFKRYMNIGIAVDTPDGLVVPVIRGADKMGVWALAEKAQELAEKARTKKLALDDLSGGTFTISSLGNMGGTGFTPIINAPEVAILGVAKSTVQPVWQGTEFAPKRQLPLSLSYDHRVINGSDGGHFMVTLTELLSDIRRLSL